MKKVMFFIFVISFLFSATYSIGKEIRPAPPQIQPDIDVAPAARKAFPVKTPRGPLAIVAKGPSPGLIEMILKKAIYEIVETNVAGRHTCSIRPLAVE